MTESQRSLRVRVDLRLTEDERNRLTEEAKQRGMSRQDLLRQRVLSQDDQPVNLPRKRPRFRQDGRETIDKAIKAAQRVNPGLPLQRLEPIVCSVICALTTDS